MSFDVTLWIDETAAIDPQKIHEFFVADPGFTVDRVWPTDLYTVSLTGPAAGYAVFDVERFDLTEFDAGDLDELRRIPGLTWTGVRFELTYSAPLPVAEAAFEILVRVVEKLHLLAIDEQGDDHPIAIDGLRSSWRLNTAVAERVIEHRTPE